MTLADDLRAAAGGVDRRCKVPRRRRTTLGPVSVEMLIQAADEIERLELKAETKQYLVMQRDIDKNELRRYIERLGDENRRLHSALLAIINTRRDPVTIAREALGDE